MRGSRPLSRWPRPRKPTRPWPASARLSTEQGWAVGCRLKQSPRSAGRSFTGPQPLLALHAARCAHLRALRFIEELVRAQPIDDHDDDVRSRSLSVRYVEEKTEERDRNQRAQTANRIGLLRSLWVVAVSSQSLLSAASHDAYWPPAAVYAARHLWLTVTELTASHEAIFPAFARPQAPRCARAKRPASA